MALMYKQLRRDSPPRCTHLASTAGMEHPPIRPRKRGRGATSFPEHPSRTLSWDGLIFGLCHRFAASRSPPWEGWGRSSIPLRSLDPPTLAGVAGY